MHRLLLECATTTTFLQSLSMQSHFSHRFVPQNCTCHRNASQSEIPKQLEGCLNGKVSSECRKCTLVVIHRVWILFHRQSVFSAACENCSGVSYSMLLPPHCDLLSHDAHIFALTIQSAVFRVISSQQLRSPSGETMRNNLVSEKIISQDLLNQRDASILIQWKLCFIIEFNHRTVFFGLELLTAFPCILMHQGLNKKSNEQGREMEKTAKKQDQVAVDDYCLLRRSTQACLMYLFFSSCPSATHKGSSQFTSYISLRTL